MSTARLGKIDVTSIDDAQAEPHSRVGVRSAKD